MAQGINSPCKEYTTQHMTVLFIAILCGLVVICRNGDIRLVNGMNEYEGRVELCIGETWGTVCDDFWGTPDAEVVCRQLGYNSTGAMAFNFAFFGQGTGPIFIDDVSCVGTETRLVSCRSTPVGTHNCIHLEDAGVRCPAPEGKYVEKAC